MTHQQLDADDRYWSPWRILIAAVAIIVLLPAIVAGVHQIKVLVLTRTTYGNELDRHETFFNAVHEASQLPVNQFNTTDLRIPVEEIKSGGPPRDGIPSLVDPPVVMVSEATFLPDDARVVGVAMDGVSRAYPFAVLNWHEAINDRLGDTPLGVFYCPLCDSVSVIDRRIGGKTLTFGISGLLHNSNVLLYDRNDFGLWSQVGLEAVSGPFSGESLDHLPWEITTFGAWRERNPESTVVSYETGHEREYGSNPYTSYFEGGELRFPVANEDGRLPAMTRIVGVRVDGETRAYPLDAVGDHAEGGLEDEIAGQRLVLQFEPGTEEVAVVESPEDAEVVHTFWFAWAAFHPDTEIFGQ